MKLTMNNQKKNKRLALLVACSFGLSVAFGIAPVGTTNDMGLLGGSVVEAASSQSTHVTSHDKKGKKHKKGKKAKKPTKPQQKVKPEPVIEEQVEEVAAKNVTQPRFHR